MSYFEYKVVPAPSTRRWRQRSVDGMDKYASTVSDILTEMGLEGWDFVGAEALRERRRKFLILICDVERTLMIFRRQVVGGDLEGKGTERRRTADIDFEPVRPRRVSRPELIEAVAAGARRVEVKAVREASETINEECAAPAPHDAAPEPSAAETATRPAPSGDHGLAWAVKHGKKQGDGGEAGAKKAQSPDERVDDRGSPRLPKHPYAAE